MMMQMLQAGGLAILTDGMRRADESNPQGYYELERVKQLEKGGNTEWLRSARGKALKIIAFLLKYLPQDLNYKVILMERDLEEVLASQSRMLDARGESAESDDERMRVLFEEHLRQTKRLLAGPPCFEVIVARYDRIVSEPLETAQRIGRFLGGGLNVKAMAAAVHPELYRSRRGAG